jgi:hypothetical protein
MDVSGQLHAPAAVPPRINPRYSQDRMLWRREKSLAAARNRTPAVLHVLVAIPTELSWLSKNDDIIIIIIIIIIY